MVDCPFFLLCGSSNSNNSSSNCSNSSINKMQRKLGVGTMC